MLEKLLGQHCGPALAGIKPANVMAVPKVRIPDAHAKIDRLNAAMGEDICIDILCECEARILVMVYRRSVLHAHLRNRSLQRFLVACGYPQDGPDEQLAYLRTRLTHDGFPHEIGVFLGYPLHDIHGFIHHRDQGCLLSGEWKVYHDPEGAQRLFSRYTACRRAIVRRLEKGQTLAQIFRAA